MPARIPLICIPDTCALIHLRDIEIIGRDARLWIWDEFEVRVAPTILDEVNRHPNLMKGQLKGKIKRSISDMPFSREQIEQIFLAPLDVTFGQLDDLGERDNCSVALQLITKNHARQIIFLTDELGIMHPEHGFLKKLFDSYPIGMVWNSLDFLLYLYLRQKRFPFDEAQYALRTVNTNIGGKVEIVTQRIVRYTRHLRHIESARRHMPNLW